MSYHILDLYAERHSFYDINGTTPVSEKDVLQIIKRCLELYPSPFNSQSARLVVLFGAQKQRFWQLTEEALFHSAPQEKHKNIKKKIDSFAAGFGTLLYFYDTDVISKQEHDFPLYAENFTNWALQSNAILQFMIWSAFAEKKIGASLQHYNPLVDDIVAREFNILPSWKLVAQMPFGGIVSVPEPHKSDNIENMIIVK